MVSLNYKMFPFPKGQRWKSRCSMAILNPHTFLGFLGFTKKEEWVQFSSDSRSWSMELVSRHVFPYLKSFSLKISSRFFFFKHGSSLQVCDWTFQSPRACLFFHYAVPYSCILCIPYGTHGRVFELN